MIVCVNQKYYLGVVKDIHVVKRDNNIKMGEKKKERKKESETLTVEKLETTNLTSILDNAVAEVNQQQSAWEEDNNDFGTQSKSELEKKKFN